MSTVQESAEAKPASLALPKTIFVGSSSKPEDKNLAAQIVKALHTPTVHPKCWTEEFPLGLLTFEALERMLRTCAGAVFIVTEDGSGHFNNNVMIELGLVAGRMGRKRVALCCTSNKIGLPSDLDALTRIENILEPSNGKEDAKLSSQAIRQLRNWAGNLPVTPEGIPCTQVLHGYSGRWKVVLNFTTWRTKNIQEGKECEESKCCQHGKEVNHHDIAGLDGELILHVPCDGIGGFGILTGKVTLHWKTQEHAEPYTGIFHLSALVSGVICPPDGIMTLRTQTFIRQTILEKGPSSPDEALPEDLAMPWIFGWECTPVKSEPGLMDIKLRTHLPDNWTSGEGSAYKEA